jgi:hypothetical protein
VTPFLSLLSPKKAKKVPTEKNVLLEEKRKEEFLGG